MSKTLAVVLTFLNDSKSLEVITKNDLETTLAEIILRKEIIN